MTRLSIASLATALLMSATPASAISALDLPNLTFPPSPPVNTSKDCNNPATLTADCPAGTTRN